MPVLADLEAPVRLGPTLDLDRAARADWDVLVVGAGPAGSLAARELARRGVRVLLVDKARFPRGKVCGCCLNAAALALLDRAGLGAVAGRAVPLRHVRLAGWRRQARFALPGGVALSRGNLDAALARAALAAGAHFLPGTAARLGGAGPGGRALLLTQGERRAEVAGRLVLAADGLNGTLMAAPARRGSRVGAGAVAAVAPDFYAPGTIFLACGPGGYLGLVRLEDGRLDLAAAWDAAFLQRARGPAGAAALTLAAAGWPAVPGLDRLAWRGTPALTRRTARPAAERVLALGDAAGYVEPFTGEGMAWALAAAIAVAPLAARACRRWTARDGREWQRLFHGVVARRQRLCRAAAWVLRRPPLARRVIGLLGTLPALAAPFVRRLNAPFRIRKAGCP